MTYPLPISPYQAPFWELHDKGLNNPAHHLAVAVRLRGPLDRAALAEALDAVSARHEALRLVFAPRGEAPAQSVCEPDPVPLKVIDLEALEPGAQEARLPEIFIAEHLPLFDLSAGRPFRALLVRLSPQDHVLVLTAHHIATDGRSSQVVFGEVLAIYEDRVAGRASTLAPPRRDLAGIVALQTSWLRPDHAETLAAYWRGRLQGWRPGLDLTTDRPRAARRVHRTAAVPIALDNHLRGAVEALAAHERAGVASVLLSAWQALLAGRTGQEEVTVLSPLANRWKRDQADLVGLFTNTIVLRSAVPVDISFRDLLANVRRSSLSDFSHGALPLSWLERFVPEARALRRIRARYADWVRFNLLPPVPERWAPPGSLTVEPLPADFGAAGEDLHLQLQATGDRFEGALHFDAGCFDRATAEGLIDDYKALLERVCAAPAEPAVPRPVPRPAAFVVSLSATFTAEPLLPALKYWTEALNLPTEARFGPYNQLHQQLLDPGGAFAGAGAGVVLVRAEDYLRDRSGAAPDLARLASAMRDLGAALDSAAARGIPLLVLSCPASPETLADPALGGALDAAEAGLAAAVPNGTLVRAEELLRRAGEVPYDDRHTDEIARSPYTPAFYAVLGSAVARWLYALRRPPLKVVVADCDETLWRGVVGEVGPAAVVIDPARRRLQERLLALQRRGVLLCLASKNRDADVLAVLDDHPHMVIRREHLVAWRIDWTPKSENVASLARELGLGLESFVFLDDNPLECWEMQQRLPEVLTLELPREPEALQRFLDQTWGLDPSPRAATAEDRARTAMVQQNAAREQVRRGTSNLGEFLASLNLDVAMAPLFQDDLERAAQLTTRTNQFNLSTRRRTVAELRALEGAVEGRTVRVRDRFGDYGLVGLVLYAAAAPRLVVDTFLLSCRVLGRGVEHRVLAELGREALAHGIAEIDLPFVRTARNQPAEAFLQGLPAIRREEGEISWFLLSAEDALALTPALDAPPVDIVETPVTPTSAPRAAPSELLQRAAREGADPARLAALLAGQRRGGASRGEGAPPRTPTEQRLAPIWAEALSVDSVSREDNFFDAGDSLHAVQLLAGVRKVFGLKEDLSAILDHPTLAELARRIDAVLAGEVAAAASPLDLRAETRLPVDFALGAPDRGVPHGRVFLTGASGALGPHLLSALLARGDAQVVCLVRARDADEGMGRLRQAFVDQLLPTEGLDRVEVLVGDLEQPWLGLPRADFDALGTRVDAIFHNGARLGDLLPYGALRAANVGGTVSVLQLAALARTPVHHVSTLSILDPADADPGEIRDERFDLERSAGLEGGYNQSKWVAERLVAAARDLGLPVSIYRLGLISGHSVTGATTLGGTFSRVLAALVRLGACTPAPMAALPLVPVDFCAQAIAALARSPASLGEVFHLCAPEPLPVDQLFELIRACGHPLEALPLDAWRARIEARREMSALADVLEGLASVRPAPRFGCDRSFEALAETPVWFPPLDAVLVGRYLAFLRDRGALP